MSVPGSSVSDITQVLLFHSALGVRAGITGLAEALRAAGHSAEVVDQYDGQVFDDYESAMSHVESVGMPALMGSALEGAKQVSGAFVAVGFSNGSGTAQWVAANRPEDARCVVMVGGGMPMRYLEREWPKGVPGQIHVTEGDPWHEPEADDMIRADLESAGAELEIFRYPGEGHLFNDPTLPAEYDVEAARLLTERVVAFVGEVG